MVSSPRPRPSAAAIASLCCCAALGALALACREAPPPLREQLQECTLDGIERPVLCGQLEVPEDPRRPDGRTIPIAFALLPAGEARGERASDRDAVFYLAGGPGSSAIGEATVFAHELAERESPYDLVFVDQRGAGRSHPLRCPYQDEPAAIVRLWLDMFPADGVRACREALSGKAELPLYTTTHAAADVDAVRRALGYGAVSLFGTSGGTRVALVYARSFPHGVARMVLQGPVPTHVRMPLFFARDLQEAIDGLVAECASSVDCATHFPSFGDDLRAVAERLATAPVEVAVELPPPESGTVTLRLTRGLYAQVVRSLLYTPAGAARLPWVVSRARQGDYEPLADAAARSARGLNRLAIGLYLSATCAEDVPFFTLKEARAASAGTLLGSVRVDAQRAACAEWPRGDLPAGFHDPVSSDVPTLILVGARDPATPPRNGEEIARHLSHHRLVVVPEGGHSFAQMTGQDCVRHLQRSFLAGTPLEELDASCVPALRRPPFFLGEAEPTAPAPAAPS